MNARPAFFWIEFCHSCEHRSMTSSTTDVYDRMQTRPAQGSRCYFSVEKPVRHSTRWTTRHLFKKHCASCEPLVAYRNQVFKMKKRNFDKKRPSAVEAMKNSNIKKLLERRKLIGKSAKK